MTKGIILLDRDGVLNRHTIHPEQGTIDSPLHPSQVEVYESAMTAAAELTRAGYPLAIITNQPAAAKGKTTYENLEAVHSKVLEKLKDAGAKIHASYICYHRAEDACECRKPKTKLLEQALEAVDAKRENSWMVGDAITDVQAGQAAGVKTAYLGPKKLEHERVFQEHGVLLPDLWCASLAEFVAQLKGRYSS